MLYAASLDQGLPEAPQARYAEADTRFRERLLAARARGADPSIVYPDLYGRTFTLDEAVGDLLSCESEVLEQTE